MMNKHIRMMIDEIFSEMKMTAENLALRDELLANAQARFDDAVAMGRSEDEAFIEVAASLGDVQALLDEMNGGHEAEPAKLHMPQEEPKEPQKDETEKEAQSKQAAGNGLGDTDLGEALNKAFAVLGDWGQQMMPQAKRFVRQMDDATGGMIKDIGKAAQKGLRDAQKAAEETLSKLSGDQGELIFDFGPKKQESGGDMAGKPQQMRKEAQDLRAQAGIKEVTGDARAAKELNDRADALETQADALEQAQAMEEARRAAEQAAQAETAEAPQGESAGEAGEKKAQIIDENGEIDEEALAREVDELTQEAEDVIQQAAGHGEAADDCRDAEYTVRDAGEAVSGRMSFPAAGLHQVDIQLDADDVYIEAAQGNEVETLWEARNTDGEPVLEMSGHTLSIRRKNPDVFKTFFSVFSKNGGKITVRVPVGYAASYKVSTTSGDVMLRGVDADDVKVTTTSGCVRVETLTSARVQSVSVTTVSGHAAVSACADDIAVTTVSGDQFVSCDAKKVDVNVVSGKTHLEGSCDEWEIEAVSSDVELLCTVAPTKKVQIASMHGTVRLALPQDIRGFVAETNSALGCAIVNEFGSNRYGTCALPIRMDTMRGQLMITRL